MGKEYSKLRTQNKTERKIEKSTRKISRTVSLHSSTILLLLLLLLLLMMMMMMMMMMTLLVLSAAAVVVAVVVVVVVVESTIRSQGTKSPMLVSKLYSGTSKTMQLVPVHEHLPFFWKSHCATCSPACVILYHVTVS